VLFLAGLGELRIHTIGEPSSRVVDVSPEPMRGIAWLADDTLVLCQGGRTPKVRRMKITGEPLPDVAVGSDGSLNLPRPIGSRTDHVLALRDLGGVSRREIVLLRLADGAVTKIADALASTAVADGYIFAVQESGLVAIPFDRDNLVVMGAAVRLPESVDWDPATGVAALSAGSGVLAIRNAVELLQQFEWLDGTGRTLGTVGAPEYFGAFALSPDERRIVARLIPGPRRSSGLRLIDIERGVTSSIATPPGLVSDPIWTADGTRIVYRLDNAVMRQSPAAASAEKLRDGNYYPDSASPDGRWMVGGRPQSGGGFRLFVLPMDGTGEPQPLSAEGGIADEAAFSPNGRLVAFHSGRTGLTEIYVSPVPLTGEVWQVSPGGGVQPRWSPDGRWLHYLDYAGTLVRVTVSAGSPPQFGRPEKLFDLGVGAPSVTLEQYAVANGRFLALRPARDAPAKPVVVLSSWTNILPRPSAGVP
jgi:hypothetical protein